MEKRLLSLDVASDDPSDEALSCRCRAWDVKETPSNQKQQGKEGQGGNLESRSKIGQIGQV